MEPIIQNEVSQKDKDQYSILMHIYGILKDGNDNPICKTEKDTDVQNRVLDSVGEGDGGMIWENSTETSILSRVKQIISPGWMHETSAQGWCTGKTQRDGMGREVGGGSGWGTHVNPWLIHVNVWQKPLQCCKVISLQLIKINGKNKIKNKTQATAESPCLLQERAWIHQFTAVSTAISSLTARDWASLLIY